MKKIHINRLLRIAKHLRSDKLAHPAFCFSHYNSRLNGRVAPKFAKKGCGTSGCAIGELPAIWPRYFRWQDTAVLRIEYSSGITRHDAAEFLGLDFDDYDLLFIPRDGYTMNMRGLSRFASAVEVAANIEKFCAEQSKAK